MDGPTHLRKENLIYAQEMADAVQVIIKKSYYLLKLGESHQETIEWEEYEGQLYDRTKRFLDPKKEK